jgi:holliday junction DNA helicase RuvA
MIATLEGIVSEKLQEIVVVNVGGVGYGVLTPTEDFSQLAVGQPAKIYVYEHIRESAHDLYGFCALDSKSLFEQLLGVNGVGPRMALNMLSVGSAGEVRQAIATGDVKFIQQANGVGKRVAERVVVDLKDKVGLSGVDLAATGLLQSEAVLTGDEAAQALIALGYSNIDAAKALDGIDPSLPTDQRVKQALKL